MNARQHALIARALIKACGGVDECANICRVERTELYKYTDPNILRFMPADVIQDLQDYCGQPLYAQAMLAARPGKTEAACAVEESSDLTEAAADLQRLVRLAAKDGDLSPAEKLEIEAGLQVVEGEVHQLRAAIDDKP